MILNILKILYLKGEFVVEIQIQDLVCAIKKDGVDAAQAEADRIIAEAKNNASVIIAQAKEEATRIHDKAKKDIEILKESAKTAAEHAKRDAMLFYKKSVLAEFERILEADVSKTVKGETLAFLIKAVINDDDISNYTVEVAEVTEGLKGELAKELQSGLEMKVSTNIRNGFRLSYKDGSGYFDCSDDELTQMLMPLFSELVI